MTRSGDGLIDEMDKAVRYHSLFPRDVSEAAAWYDQRVSGLGDAFVDLVKRCVADVIADPQRFALLGSQVRYIRIPRFPYIILFQVTPVELRLLGVVHTARSIEKWREERMDTW